MAKRPSRAPLARGAVFCAIATACGHAALADETPGAADTSTAATPSTAIATPDSTGPLGATPSLLTATGINASGPDVRVGNLGDQLARSLAGRPVEPNTGRNWSITPSIGLTEEYIDGSGGLGGGSSRSGGNQFVTILQPTLLATGDTTRLHGEFSYRPQIELYPEEGSENQFNQNFDGRLLTTLVPQSLFLDLRASAAVQATTPGQPPNETSTLGRGNTTQTYSVSAAPYAVHRFGPWGTGELGGFLAETTQTAQHPSTVLGSAFNQDVTTTGGHLAFSTGEAFGRYNGTALAQATQFDGTGVLDDAHRDTATLDSGYALTRTITALLTVGWERIHYGGSSPVQIDDAIWNAGIRLVPNPLSTLTLRYGHQDGLNALTLDAAYQPTARTRIYARYSTGLSTQSEQLQNALATSDLDALGSPVDHLTGAPLVATGNFFGSQNSLYKTRIASLTGVLLLDRDTLSASLNSQDQTLESASNALGVAYGNTSGVYGALTWSHQLRPNIQTTLYLQYGTQSSGLTSGDQRLLSASASVSYALTPTLAGQVQLSYNERSGGSDRLSLAALGGAQEQGGGSQAVFLVSLIKSF